MNYYTLSEEDALKELNSTREGLTEKEVEARILKYGKNILERKKKTSKLKIFLRQFQSFLVLILVFAAIFSIFISFYGEGSSGFIDAIVIVAIIIINAVLGFVQEYKAEKALEALEKLAAPKATVIRDGRKKIINSTDLVPGDVIFLEVGSQIPADARILESFNLKADESIITGESVPVSKDEKTIDKECHLSEQTNMLLMDSIVTQGKCKALVVTTGMSTEVGKIAKLIEVEEEQTEMQERLQEVGKNIGIIIIVISALVFGLEFFRSGQIFETFLTAVSLAVAAVPEGLPVVITISLAVGVQRMVRRNAIVKKLPSVENLGCATVICSDKTGTLTKNEMTVRQVYLPDEVVEVSGIGYSTKGEIKLNNNELEDSLNLLLKGVTLCNNAELVENEKIFGDPTEAALLVLAKKRGVDYNKLKKDYKRVFEFEFSSERKMMSTVHKRDGEFFVFSKGAPELLIKNCSSIFDRGRKRKLDNEDKNRILDTTHKMANNALRVLGVAYKEVGKEYSAGDAEKNLVFLGLVAMIDPPRKEVIEAIKVSRGAGIKVKMITGDHALTAKAIGEELGMFKKGDEVLRGEEIDRISDEELFNKVMNVSVFARVSPEHKVKILKALKKHGEIVAMTGDGVNDAPALKNADIGIAVGSGTDVAKEASNLILEDNDFATIVSAVEEGRGIYDNIKKFVNYMLTANAGEVLIIFVASLISLPLPLIAVQILWINLLTDGLPAVALSVDPFDKKIMKRKPRSKNERIISTTMIHSIIIVAVIMTIAALYLFSSELEISGDLEKARTMVLAVVVLFELVRVQVVRSEYNTPFFTNKYLSLALLSSILLLLMLIYIPYFQILFKTTALVLADWTRIISITAIVFVVMEMRRYLYRFLKI